METRKPFERKFGKEKYSYMLSNYERVNHSSLEKVTDPRWGAVLREKHREEFNKSYENYTKTGEVVIFEQALRRK